MFLGREISEQRDYSDQVAETIDDEVYNLIDTANHNARDIIVKHRAKLTKLAKYLIDHETVEEDELIELLDARPPLPDAALA